MTPEDPALGHPACGERGELSPHSGRLKSRETPAYIPYALTHTDARTLPYTTQRHYTVHTRTHKSQCSPDVAPRAGPLGKGPLASKEPARAPARADSCRACLGLAPTPAYTLKRPQAATGRVPRCAPLVARRYRGGTLQARRRAVWRWGGGGGGVVGGGVA